MEYEELICLECGNERFNDGNSFYCPWCSRRLAKEHNDIKRQKFKQIKDNLSCVICGETENCCLDFHHLDPSKKEGRVSSMVNSAGWKKLLNEINKCTVLCSNCHRKVHAGLINLPDHKEIQIVGLRSEDSVSEVRWQ